MKAKTIKGSSVQEISQSLAESTRDGFKPTLAIVFLSTKQDYNQIGDILDQAGLQYFGATTHGVFTGDGIAEGSTVILLTDVNPEYFSIHYSDYLHKNYRETAQKIASEALDKFLHPCFLMVASHLETDAEELLRGMEDIIGPEVNVYGAMAGDDYRFAEQFVFTNGYSSDRGVVILAFNEEKLTIKGIAIGGWQPMGTEKTVTKSQGNRIYTIDNMPVVEMIKKYSGLENFTSENPNIELEIATTFPFQLQRSAGMPVMRPVVSINWEDGSFICSGSMPEGSKVRFSLPPDFDVIEKVVEGCHNLKAKEMPEADAVIVFNCGGRVIALGPMIEDEIEGVKKVWEVPLAGMFSNAELARATGGKLEMHNLTTCCVAIKEKE